MTWWGWTLVGMSLAGVIGMAVWVLLQRHNANKAAQTALDLIKAERVRVEKEEDAKVVTALEQGNKLVEEADKKAEETAHAGHSLNDVLNRAIGK